jgi:multiple RNA-binding domain-containing protein 1
MYCQVIAQTKAALLDGNINVSALEAAAAASGKAAAKASVARSATTLLVKNLPYSSDEEELRSLFAGPGGSRSVVRLVLPPTRTLALVEFGEPQDAR